MLAFTVPLQQPPVGGVGTGSCLLYIAANEKLDDDDGDGHAEGGEASDSISSSKQQ